MSDHFLCSTYSFFLLFTYLCVYLFIIIHSKSNHRSILSYDCLSGPSKEGCDWNCLINQAIVFSQKKNAHEDVPLDLMMCLYFVHVTWLQDKMFCVHTIFSVVHSSSCWPWHLGVTYSNWESQLWFLHSDASVTPPCRSGYMVRSQNGTECDESTTHVCSYKYLGVHIDSALCWRARVESLSTQTWCFWSWTEISAVVSSCLTGEYCCYR